MRSYAGLVVLRRKAQRTWRGEAEQVDAMAQDHAVHGGVAPSKVDAGLHRNHQLDDFPSALGPAAGPVGAAIGAVLHHVLHPMGRCHEALGACLEAGHRSGSASSSAIRRCNRSITACNSAMSVPFLSLKNDKTIYLLGRPSHNF